jgi:hypothetical protein
MSALSPMRSLMQKALDQMNLYWENKGASFFAVKGVVVTTAVSVSQTNSILLHRSWAGVPQAHSLQQALQGRALCGLEQPKLFSGGGRAGFRSLR